MPNDSFKDRRNGTKGSQKEKELTKQWKDIFN